jgi:hypothetical protein
MAVWDARMESENSQAQSFDVRRARKTTSEGEVSLEAKDPRRSLPRVYELPSEPCITPEISTLLQHERMRLSLSVMTHIKFVQSVVGK